MQECKPSRKLNSVSFSHVLRLGLLLSFAVATLSKAATVTVNTSNDVVDGDTSSIVNLIATPGGDSNISLREAITAANNTPGLDEVNFSDGIPGNPIVLTHVDGDLDITDPNGLTIEGTTDASLTVIDGNDTDRVFDHHEGNLTIIGLTIRNGNSLGGSGIRSNVSSSAELIIENSTVTNNTTSGAGGGLFVSGQLSRLTVDRCIFSDNQASSLISFGGAISISTANSPDIIIDIQASLFSNNIASDNGGAIDNSSVSGTLQIDRCLFVGNQVTDTNTNNGGGALSLSLSGTTFIRHSSFENNTSGRDGGAIQRHSPSFVLSGNFLTIEHCSITGNSAGDRGGGIFDLDGGPGLTTIRNTTISGNRADGSGGGLYSGSVFTTNLDFVTITQNSADNDNDSNGDGGGILAGGFNTFNIQNSIIQGNTDKSTPTNDDCITLIGVANSLGGNVFGLNTGCPVDPNDTTLSANLGPLQNNGGDTLTHALLPGSAAIDFAVCGAITTDQIDQPRDDGFCDSGAFEFTVNTSNNADLNGDERVDMIDFSLFAGNFGCTGFCIADLNSDGETNVIDLSLWIEDWLRHYNALICLFQILDPDLTDVDSDNIPDICECSDGSEDCVVNTTSGIKYSTIQAAIDAASNSDDIVVFPGTYNETIDFSGKDITLRSSDPNNPTVVNTTIIDCDCPSAAEDQNVVSFINGESNAALLNGFTIQGAKNQVNTGTPGSLGGGIRIDASSNPTIKNCVIKDNEIITGSADNQDGGGIYVGSNCFPIIQNSIILGNTAGNRGGGLFVRGNSRPEVTNCLIAKNTAGATAAASKGFGGGVYCQGGNPFDGDDSGYVGLTNCTIADNVSRTQGAGVDIEQYDDQINRVDIINCIIYHNTLDDLTPSSLKIEPGRDSSFYSVTYSNIEGGFAGTGNIDSDPNFAFPAFDDYYVTSGSPCIDAGDNTAISLPTDVSGFGRKVDDPATADTGNGTAPIVDMGAYEFHP